MLFLYRNSLLKVMHVAFYGIWFDSEMLSLYPNRLLAESILTVSDLAVCGEQWFCMLESRVYWWYLVYCNSWWMSSWYWRWQTKIMCNKKLNLCLLICVYISWMQSCLVHMMQNLNICGFCNWGYTNEVDQWCRQGVHVGSFAPILCMCSFVVYL